MCSEGVGGFLARFSRTEERDPDIDVLEDMQRAMDKFDEDSVSVQAGIPSELESQGESRHLCVARRLSAGPAYTHKRLPQLPQMP